MMYSSYGCQQPRDKRSLRSFAVSVVYVKSISPLQVHWHCTATHVKLTLNDKYSRSHLIHVLNLE